MHPSPPGTPDPRQQLGRDGEAAARTALRARGYVILAERWPTKDRALMRSVVEALTASDVWQTVAIDPDASDRWMRILTEEGMVSSPPSYDELADDTFMKPYR